jgi:hypothetical protein
MSQELEFLADVTAYRQKCKLSDLTLQFPRRQSVLISTKNVDNHHEKNSNYRRRRNRPRD